MTKNKSKYLYQKEEVPTALYREVPERKYPVKGLVIDEIRGGFGDNVQTLEKDLDYLQERYPGETRNVLKEMLIEAIPPEPDLPSYPDIAVVESRLQEIYRRRAERASRRQKSKLVTTVDVFRATAEIAGTLAKHSSDEDEDGDDATYEDTDHTAFDHLSSTSSRAATKPSRGGRLMLTSSEEEEEEEHGEDELPDVDIDADVVVEGWNSGSTRTASSLRSRGPGLEALYMDVDDAITDEYSSEYEPDDTSSEEDDDEEATHKRARISRPEHRKWAGLPSIQEVPRERRITRSAACMTRRSSLRQPGASLSGSGFSLYVAESAPGISVYRGRQRGGSPNIHNTSSPLAASSISSAASSSRKRGRGSATEDVENQRVSGKGSTTKRCALRAIPVNCPIPKTKDGRSKGMPTRSSSTSTTVTLRSGSTGLRELHMLSV